MEVAKGGGDEIGYHEWSMLKNFLFFLDSTNHETI